MKIEGKAISHSVGGGIFAHSFIALSGSAVQARASKTSENDGDCLVCFCASLFTIAFGCIFCPGHFGLVAPRAVLVL